MPNPRTKEFPLRHRHSYDFTLQEFETSATHFATYLPLFVADQAKTEAVAQGIQVNPSADGHAGEIKSPNCFMNSRINKVRITEYAMIPTAADVPDNIYWKAIVSWGLGDYQVKDPSGVTLLSKLKFEQSADTINPDYTGVNCENGSIGSAEQDGLTSDAELEDVALTPASLKSEHNLSLGAKINAMVDGPYANRVHKDYPYFRDSWYAVPGRVKRMNAFTGCFLYVGIETAADETPAAQAVRFTPHFQSDLTIDENSINLHYVVHFNEYNDSFDQSA